jgi:hypothetical protein
MGARFQVCAIVAFLELADLASPAGAQAIPFSLNLSGRANTF